MKTKNENFGRKECAWNINIDNNNNIIFDRYKIKFKQKRDLFEFNHGVLMVWIFFIQQLSYKTNYSRRMPIYVKKIIVKGINNEEYNKYEIKNLIVKRMQKKMLFNIKVIACQKEWKMLKKKRLCRE